MFSKCVDAILAAARDQGVELPGRLVDLLPQEGAVVHTAIVTEPQAKLGLTLNEAKSQLIPVQSTVYLGLRLDSTKVTPHAPDYNPNTTDTIGWPCLMYAGKPYSGGGKPLTCVKP
ncbi:UNVERIFIED_CONTAM: hypothetical protein FKN15_037965 [Acipenser sinensis]